jgi:hypothetical protein
MLIKSLGKKKIWVDVGAYLGILLEVLNSQSNFVNCEIE